MDKQQQKTQNNAAYLNEQLRSLEVCNAIQCTIYLTFCILHVTLVNWLVVNFSSEGLGFTSLWRGWRQLWVAALTHNTLFLTHIGDRELFKHQPLTQVGLFTVSLDPRPSCPQLLQPNMKSFPFSVETKTAAPERLYLLLHLEDLTLVQGWASF